MDVFQIYIVKENVYCIANYNLPCTDDFVVYLQYQHFPNINPFRRFSIRRSTPFLNKYLLANSIIYCTNIRQTSVIVVSGSADIYCTNILYV